jgi:hypothetical protein
MGALTQRDWKHRIYVFHWAMKNLNPSQLNHYYKLMLRYRAAYFIRVQEVVDEVGALLHQYRIGTKSFSRSTGMSGADCGCGCAGSGACGGMGNFDPWDAFNQVADGPPSQTQSNNRTTSAFNPADPRHWTGLINSGVDVVKKIGCMADPNLPFCKGQAAIPQTMAELCKQAPNHPACATYNKNPMAYQPVVSPPTTKKDNMVLVVGGVAAGLLFMAATQRRER